MPARHVKGFADQGGCLGWGAAATSPDFGVAPQHPPPGGLPAQLASIFLPPNSLRFLPYNKGCQTMPAAAATAGSATDQVWQTRRPRWPACHLFIFFCCFSASHVGCLAASQPCHVKATGNRVARRGVRQRPAQPLLARLCWPGCCAAPFSSSTIDRLLVSDRFARMLSHHLPPCPPSHRKVVLVRQSITGPPQKKLSPRQVLASHFPGSRGQGLI